MGGDGGRKGQGNFGRLTFFGVIQQLRMLRDKTGVEIVTAEIRVIQNLLVVVGRRLDTVQTHVIEGADAAGDQP